MYHLIALGRRTVFGEKQQERLLKIKTPPITRWGLRL